MRFTIQPKEGGGAIYKAFRNGNFLVPIWSYVTSTYEFTGNQTFFWSAYWGESNSSRKEIIFDNHILIYVKYLNWINYFQINLKYPHFP